LKVRHFSPDAEVIAAAEAWLDGQISELFLSDLQKLEFGRCSFFPSWSVLRTYHHPGTHPDDKHKVEGKNVHRFVTYYLQYVQER
jgi:hypothetical protein